METSGKRGDYILQFQIKILHPAKATQAWVCAGTLRVRSWANSGAEAQLSPVLPKPQFHKRRQRISPRSSESLLRWSPRFMPINAQKAPGFQ